LGDVRLTSEEADNLGFPSITLTTTIPGYSYDASVYAGLRRFHEGKGFDPDSQDVARHLDLPLIELCGKFAPSVLDNGKLDVSCIGEVDESVPHGGLLATEATAENILLVKGMSRIFRCPLPSLNWNIGIILKLGLILTLLFSLYDLTYPLRRS
jgi:hypothetical protein